MIEIKGRELTVEQLREFARIMTAYLECSDELQAHARKMLNALADQSLDEDDRKLAALTLADLLFPDPHDLKECEAQGAAHSDETRDVLAAMDEEEASFALRLRAAMDKSGMTQSELAEKIGVGQPAISMMLQRDCRPQKRTVIKLAQALGVDPAELWPNHRLSFGAY